MFLFSIDALLDSRKGCLFIWIVFLQIDDRHLAKRVDIFKSVIRFTRQNTLIHAHSSILKPAIWVHMCVNSASATNFWWSHAFLLGRNTLTIWLQGQAFSHLRTIDRVVENIARFLREGVLNKIIKVKVATALSSSKLNLVGEHLVDGVGCVHGCVLRHIVKFLPIQLVACLISAFADQIFKDVCSWNRPIVKDLFEILFAQFVVQDWLFFNTWRLLLSGFMKGNWPFGRCIQMRICETWLQRWQLLRKHLALIGVKRHSILMHVPVAAENWILLHFQLS